MKGYPHWLNTRFDYEYVADHFPREQWAKDWQALLDDMMQWQYVSDLTYRSEGIEDATHRIETIEKDDGTTTYQQWEYKKDDHARLYQLGFTEEEVEAKLAEPEPESEPEEDAPAHAEGETTVEPEATDAPLTDEVPAEETPVEAPAEESEAPAEDPDAPAEPAPTEEVAEEES